MKLLRALLSLLVWAFFAAPALAAITVVPLGTNTTGAGSGVQTLAITTVTNDCPVGSYVIVVAYVQASSNWGVGDSVGNSYVSVINFTNNTNQHLLMAYAKVGTDVAIGTTLTLGGPAGVGNWTTAARLGMAAACMTGLASSSPLDKTGAGWDSAGAGSNITVDTLTTGTMGVTNEVVIAAWGDGGGTYSAWNEDADFTNVGISTIGSNNNVRLAYCVTNCSATTAIFYSRTGSQVSWTTARINGANVWTFKPSTGVTCRGAFLLLGVGGC